MGRKKQAICLPMVLVVGLCGCASHQYGHLLSGEDKNLVGSHAAGAATWNPLVDEAVARLLGRCPTAVHPVSFDGDDPLAATHADGSFDEIDSPYLAAGRANVCFIGIENKSAEDLLDFKDQLYERIDSQISSSDSFRMVSRRKVGAALMQARLRPDSLFLPNNRALFASVLGSEGTPVDYLLFATITSGTTDRNRTSQRDYLLTLEIVNIHSGETVKESAKIRKGYSKTRLGKWWNFGFFDQADG